MPLIPEFNAIVDVVESMSPADQKFLAQTISHYIVAIENSHSMTSGERAEHSRLNHVAQQKETKRRLAVLRRIRPR